MSESIRGLNIAAQRRSTVTLVCLAAAMAMWSGPAGMAADASATAAGQAGANQPATPPQTQPAGPPPKFRCDEMEHKYGTVWAMEKVEHEFIVHNDGQGVLTLEARPTCSCTVAEYDKTIPPGGKGKIKTVLTAGNHSGPYNRSINVATNDPEKPNVALTLTGEVKQRVSSDPYLMAHFGQYAPGIPLTKTFKLTNNTDQPMKLELVSPPQATCFKAELKEIEPGKTAELTITAEPPFQEDSNTAHFTIRTGIEGVPDLPLPCSIIKPPAIQILPPVIRLSSNVGEVRPQAVTVRNNSDKPIKVVSAQSADPRLGVTYREAVPGKVWTVQVEPPAGYRPEPGANAAITITTDYEPKPAYTVPVLILPQQQAAPATSPAFVSSDNMLGRSAPALVIGTADGRQIRVGSDTNQVLLVNFWSSWCSASLTQLPMLEDLYQTYRRKGVEFINISVDRYRPGNEVTEFVRGLDSKIPLALDAGHHFVRSFGVSDYPTMFLIGKNGIVEDVRRGIGRNDTELDTLAQLLAERLDLLLEGKTRTDFAPRQVSFGSLCRVNPPQPPTAASVSGPVLAVEAVRQDMGAFKPASKGEYKLYYRNSGNQPLEIKSISASNNLTVDPGYSKSVAPGAVGSVLCSFQTPAEPTRFVHQVSFDTNSTVPAPPVTVGGATKPYVEVQPRKGVEFTGAVRTFSVPRLATLLYNGSGQVEYSQVKSSSPLFVAEIKETRQPHVSLLIVNAVPPFQPGDHQATITIETNQEAQPKVEVPVRLRMPERIEVVPAAVELPPGRSAQQIQVSIVNSGDTPLSILGIDRSKNEIQTQFFPEPDGHSYKLQITLPPNLELSPDGESITIRTDDKEYASIVVPLKVPASSRPRRPGPGSVIVP